MNCCKCGSPYVINKKYELCNACNYIRLHGHAPIRKPIVTKKALPKKRVAIKKVSADQSEINLKMKIVKDQIRLSAMENDLYFCQGCGSNAPVDCSHILSVGQRKDLELDPNNIELLCRSCHNKWESWNIEKMASLHCFERDMLYISLHDEGCYNKIVIMTKEFLHKENHEN